MTKREREIGRASKKEHIGGDIWESLPEDVQQYWCNLGLAAVSRAREIDTCETCKYWDDQIGCGYNHYVGGFGCNRHQPKEA